MEQFKIDVSECTDDEKRRIQERLFEMRYKRFDFGSIRIEDAKIFHLDTDGDLLFSTDGTVYSQLRPASDFLTSFQTRPHDYTGCHPDIVAALKRGEDILCKSTLKNDGDNVMIYAYNVLSEYPYRGFGWKLKDAKPIPAGTVKLRQVYTIALTDEQLAKIKEMIDE